MQVYRYMDIGSAKIRSSRNGGDPSPSCRRPGSGRGLSCGALPADGKGGHERDLYREDTFPSSWAARVFISRPCSMISPLRRMRGIHSCQRASGAACQGKGAAYLHAMLREKDPKSAEDIHENNVKRVIRALEFYQQTGKRISDHNDRRAQKRISV